VKIWIVSMVSFVVGVLVGALTFAAADRHVRSLVAPLVTSGSSVINQDKALMPDANAPVDNAAGSGAPADASDDLERSLAVEQSLRILGQRLTTLEARLAATPSSDAVAEDAGPATPSAGGLNLDTLLAAGVDSGVANDIARRLSQRDMQRLELRDQASREGWIGDERFVEQMRQLQDDVPGLREEIGEDAYDRFLYLSGQANRVKIASVIDESPAQLAGLKAGDLVLGYADSRIFSYADLRSATQAEERGEYIMIRIQRNGETLDLTLPRGPLGIRLDADQIDPDAIQAQ
jgi:membrane-associated protease RseP (regulator of RpoE activity)